MIEFQTHSPQETRAFGERLANQLQTGDVLLLSGGLGAGKSELARGIARGLGVTGCVPSPSFTILQVHDGGRLPLYHFDWYRLGGADELYELTLDEYLYDTGVSVVEWPEAAAEAIPRKHLNIVIDVTGETDRRFTLTPEGGFHPLDTAALEAQP
jgi:tRNA threonylcarbamoyladenosine biosynthesis protein TsaE